jgi:hypothetical protein
MTRIKTDWAYLAGLVDGEGCITIACGYYFRKDKGKHFWHHQERLTVGNTSRLMIEWIVEKFGGELYVHPKQYNRRQQFYEWRLRGGKSKYEEILLGILPYLKVKRKQALLLLDYVRLPQIPLIEQRTEIAEKIQALNQHGKTVTTNTPNTLPSEDRV